MTFHSTVTAYLVASGYDVEDKAEGDTVVLTFAWRGRRLDLRIKDRNWGDVGGTFFHDDYGFIAGPNKVVLDVGANVGDSALYFALQGAKKVISVEPFPAAFNLLLINVAKGGFPSVIEPVNAAIGKPFGSIILNPTATGIGQAAAAETVGVAIPTVSLTQLTKTYGIEDGMLKMDCEGAEYDVIGNSDVATLRSFAKMQIEYHHGYEPIEEHLRRAQFSVWHSPPVRTRNQESGTIMRSGFIYAERY